MFRQTLSRLRYRLASITILFVIIFSSAELAIAQGLHQQQADKFKSVLQPLLAKHCNDCHSTDNAEGGLDLNRFKSYEDVLVARERWMKLLTRVRLGDMPPVADSQITEDERKTVVAGLEDILNNLDPSVVKAAGKPTIRRLNRFEYRQTVKALTGVDYEPAKDFPGDDAGYGFDNIGDVLSLPPLLLEKYLNAAEEIAVKSIATETSVKFRKKVDAKELTGGNYRQDRRGRGAVTLASEGTATAEFQIPAEGKYEIRATVFAQQAGPDVAEMGVVANGNQLKTSKVRATEREPFTFVCDCKLKPGKTTIGVEFLNDYFNAEAADPKDRDRNLFVVSIEVRNDPDVAKATPESHSDLVFQRPSDKITYDVAAEAVIKRMASRAFRRPATAEEVTKLKRLADQVKAEGGSFEEGMQFVLQAILVSPNFLYKVEEPIPAGQSRRELTTYELSTSMAYFLWSSMPDDELLASAWEQKLRTPEERQKQVKRMLADPRARSLAENFAVQWLQLRYLDVVKPDPKLFPNFTEELKSAMREETVLCFDEIVREDKSIFELLDSDHTYVNNVLAKHYGVNDVVGREFQKVSLSKLNRAGLMTQASILTITSNPTRTSPVKRGKWILENLLAAPPPPAAPNVPGLEQQKQLTGSLKERLEQHRKNPACATCHQEMDALGFALENFDPTGRWRTQDEWGKVSIGGELPNGTKVEDAKALQKVLVADFKDEFARCLVERMLVYALGRGLEYYDVPTVDEILAKAQKEDYRFSAVVTAIVESEPFRYRSLPKFQGEMK